MTQDWDTIDYYIRHACDKHIRDYYIRHASDKHTRDSLGMRQTGTRD